MEIWSECYKAAVARRNMSMAVPVVKLATSGRLDWLGRTERRMKKRRQRNKSGTWRLHGGWKIATYGAYSEETKDAHSRV